MVQKQVNTIKQMDPRDPCRIEMTDMLLDKLYVNADFAPCFCMIAFVSFELGNCDEAPQSST